MAPHIPTATITLSIAEAFAAKDSLYAMADEARRQNQEHVCSVLMRISMRFSDMFSQDEWDRYHSTMSAIIAAHEEQEGTE